MRPPLLSDLTSNVNLNLTSMSVLAKPPPMKRRRLGSFTAGATTTTAMHASGVTAASDALPAWKGGVPTCVWCHRGLLGMPGGPVACARCSSLTCNVCSRTCTNTVPSQPPTPHLSFSPSPSPSPTIAHQRQLPFPRRSVLGARTANTNLRHPVINTPSPTPLQHSNSDVQMASQEEGKFAVAGLGSLAGKRRQIVDAREDGVENSVFGDVQNSGDGSEPGYGPGCGRVICRNCCFENVRDNATTCYDCYGS